MRSPIIALLLFTMALGGCSYTYRVVATVRDGRIVFEGDPKSSPPSCVRTIEVSAVGERDLVWRESVDYDDACANKFPIAYGVSFKGRRQPEWPTIRAKPLRRGITYEVFTTSGATGYGGGRFSIRYDGRVVVEPSLYLTGTASSQ
jgi:hypothetical protein